MVQATAAVVAIALTVTVPLVPVVNAPTCEQVHEYAKKLTRAQIHAMAKRARLTPEQWAQVQQCLPDDKK